MEYIAQLDALDRQLLDGIRRQPGTHIRAVIRPFLADRAEFPLRRRIDRLIAKGYIRVEKDGALRRLFLTETSEQLD